MRLTGRSSMAVMAGAVAMAGFALGDLSEPQRRVLAKMPRGYAGERNRKQTRAADRSKKQYLLKGIRP